GLAHDHEASQPEEGNVRSLEHGTVAVRDRAYLRGEPIGDEIEAVAPRGLGSIGRARACPERRMRFLERLRLFRHGGVMIELAVESERARGQRLAQDLQRFEVHFLSVVGIDSVIGGLDRRDAADSQLEAPLAELVEHADLLSHAQWMMQRKGIDERTEV